MTIKSGISLSLLTLLLSCPVVSKAQHAASPMQDSLLQYNKLLSSEEMQADLQVLLGIRKQVNSGLYTYRSRQQIDSLYQWAFEQVKTPMRTIDFYKIILQLTDFEGSCHNYTEPDLELMNYLKRQQSFFPYALMYLNGQIIFDGRSAEILPGSRIRSINGISDQQLMRSFYKYYRTDGYVQTSKLSSSVDKSFGVNYLLEYGLTDTYEIEYSAPGSKLSQKMVIPAVSLEERTKNEADRYSAPVTNQIDFKLQAPYSFRMISPSIGLLNLRWFGMVTGEEDPGFETYVRFIDSVFTALEKNKVQSLIIDVRSNPGGADPTFEQPVRYLTSHTFKENREAYINFDPDHIPYEQYFWGISTSQRMDSASIVAGKEFLKDRFPVYKNGVCIQNPKYNPDYTPKMPQFKGKVYLLINENVASAASHFASLVKAFVENVTIVGVETVGGYYVHNGHIPFVYELPNSKIKTQFSIVHVIQDAPQREDQPTGRGIIPDYEVWPSLEDFMQQKDTQLDFVLKLIKKN